MVVPKELVNSKEHAVAEAGARVPGASEGLVSSPSAAGSPAGRASPKREGSPGPKARKYTLHLIYSPPFFENNWSMKIGSAGGSGRS